MSLAIEIDDVIEVLLPDGWYTVEENSFNLDSYEFMWRVGMGDTAIHGGGNSGVCATGYAFKAAGSWYFGPLTAIAGVRTKVKK